MFVISIPKIILYLSSGISNVFKLLFLTPNGLTDNEFEITRKNLYPKSNRTSSDYIAKCRAPILYEPFFPLTLVFTRTDISALRCERVIKVP